MFEVLVFVYENYWRGDACPELGALERKLIAVGFDAEEIQDALTWLDDLNLAARGLQQPAPGVDASTPARRQPNRLGGTAGRTVHLPTNRASD